MIESIVPTFLPQAAARRVSFHTFSHVLNLDLHFHLNRKVKRRVSAGDQIPSLPRMIES